MLSVLLLLSFGPTGPLAAGVVVVFVVHSTSDMFRWFGYMNNNRQLHKANQIEKGLCPEYIGYIIHTARSSLLTFYIALWSRCNADMVIIDYMCVAVDDVNRSIVIE